MPDVYPSGARRAELIWEGKYDASGKRVSPLRVQLPFQTVEMVNESAQERQKALSLFESPGAYLAKEWRNRLIWGDKKYVLPSLLAEFGGKTKLIYIDPPFDTGADFSFTATVPDHRDTPEDDSFTFTKEPSIIEHKAYRDTWGRGIDSYLQWFYESATLLYELLHEDGSIYVHCDWRVSSYLRLVLNEIFGEDNFRNEISWKRRGGKTSPDAKVFEAVCDSLLWYSKSKNYLFVEQFTKFDTEEYITERFKYTDKGGRRYRLSPLNAPYPRPTLQYEYKGYKTSSKWLERQLTDNAKIRPGRQIGLSC